MSLTRRQSLALGAGAWLALGRLATNEAAAAAAPAFTLLLVNDIYKTGERDGRGGFARLAAIVKAERARGVPVLFAHAGDTLSPSPMSGFDQGAHIIELTNLIRPDIFVPGNHEFDFGKEVFLKRLGEAEFPFFAANLRQADGSRVPGIRDSAILTLGPVRVGVIGLALATTPTLSQTGDLRFLPELETLREQAARLRQEGAEFLVAVSHTDRETDDRIVRSRLVDVLLTGHDHDLAIGFDGRTVMVESSEEGNFVTAIDIAVTVHHDGKDRRLSWSPSFRVHDSSTVEPDPEVLAVVRRLETELSQELDVALATTTVTLDSRTAVVRSQEALIGNLIADAIRASTGADAAIMNAGGIRGDRQYPAGSFISRRDVLTELPFGNTTALVAITGAELEAAIENGFSLLEHRAGRFPQVSGLEVEIDAGAPPGSRVTALRIGGKPLDRAARYRVGANSFMLNGGDGYEALARGRVLIGGTDGKLLANEVMVHLRRLGVVEPSAERRILIR